MDTIVSPMSKRLRAWRDAQGISRESAARKIGVSLATYTRWESGKFQPSAMALEKIESAISQPQ